MKYKIIGSGSKGNALAISEGDLLILIDCGMSYRSLKGVRPDAILLTHEHGDHFNKSTLKRIVEDNPLTLVVTPHYLVPELIKLKVPPRNIVISKPGLELKKRDTTATLEMFHLFHDVPNVGWVVRFDFDGEQSSMMYATDTSKLDGISAPNLDYYFIEANYEDSEIEQRIAEKVASGEFAYEFRARDNHLSRARADAWIAENAGEHSKYIYMHKHI